MQISPSPLQIFTRVAAVAVFAGASTLGLHAQQATPAAQSIFYVAPQTTQSLIAANDAPSAIGYSTSAGAEETADAVGYIANASPQPPPRRYGRRPVYADSSHNADGSSKYTFAVGAGLTIPTGGTHAYLSPSYNFQAGGGRNFNKKLALLVQFDWANFGIQTSTLNDQEALYNLEIEQYNAANPGNTVSLLSQIGGSSHIWSFTIDPMYTFFQGDKTGAYVIGGLGFYHKTANFTTPGQICDPYYGICYAENQSIDTYTSNAPGYNGGVGFTYKMSRFSDLKFYTEARYVFTDNSPRQGYTLANYNTTTYNGNNAFPLNSAKTTYIPITFGVRF